MIELIKHSLGFCGEAHINLWSMLLVFGNIPILYYIKLKQLGKSLKKKK